LKIQRLVLISLVITSVITSTVFFSPDIFGLLDDGGFFFEKNESYSRNSSPGKYLNKRWTTSEDLKGISNAIDDNLLLMDNSIYSITSDNKLIQISIETGKKIDEWSDQKYRSVLMYSSDYMFVIVNKDEKQVALVALDRISKNPKWEYEFEYDTDYDGYDPKEMLDTEFWRIDGNDKFILMKEKAFKLVCLNTKDGSFVWERNESLWNYILNNELIYDTTSNLCEIKCINVKNFKEIWNIQDERYNAEDQKTRITSHYLDELCISNNIYYLRRKIAEDFYICVCLDKETREKLWEYEIPLKYAPHLRADDENLYIVASFWH
jgi:outer membrane protein assembly factor BamB